MKEKKINLKVLVGEDVNGELFNLSADSSIDLALKLTPQEIVELSNGKVVKDDDRRFWIVEYAIPESKFELIRSCVREISDFEVLDEIIKEIMELYSIKQRR